MDYERRAGNPSLDFIQRAAEALDVSVAELLGSQPKAARGKPGPTPQLQLRFERINDSLAKNRSSSSALSILSWKKLRRREVKNFTMLLLMWDRTDFWSSVLVFAVHTQTFELLLCSHK